MRRSSMRSNPRRRQRLAGFFFFVLKGHIS
jgi:hypothetical protein